MTLMRLDKFLSNMGKGSRKEIKKFLLSGEVLVNETVIKNPEYKINPEEDKIKLFSEEVLQNRKTPL